MKPSKVIRLRASIKQARGKIGKSHKASKGFKLDAKIGIPERALGDS